MIEALSTTHNGDFGDQIEVLEPISMSQLGGEVDIQIATAKRYPRSIKNFKSQALEMATFDEATAAGCFYSLPRGGKPIEGPSARLAEIILSAWGNVRADAKVIAIEEKEVIAEAMTWDLEKNVAIRVQVRRRITGKDGRRYNDDMITVTGNAACAIALRNSVFKVIPNVFTNAVYHAARQAAIGDIKTIAAKRSEMVDYFGKMGVTSDRVFAAVGKSGIEEIGLDELATLKGVATAIKDNEFTVDEAFPPIAPTGPTGVVGLKDRLKQQREDKPVEDTQLPRSAEDDPSAVNLTPVDLSEIEAANDEPDAEDGDELDELESLRADVQARYDELSKSQQKDLIAGKNPISKATQEELIALLGAMEAM